MFGVRMTMWDRLYRKEVVAQSFIVWGVGWPNEGHGDRNLTWINLSSRLLYLLSIRAALAFVSTRVAVTLSGTSIALAPQVSEALEGFGGETIQAIRSTACSRSGRRENE